MKKLIIYTLVALTTGITAHGQTLDRSIRPMPAAAPTIELKKPQMFKLANGLTVLVVENHTLPQVTASFSIDAPPVTEGSKKGVSEFASEMMGEGTRRQSKEAFDSQVDDMASTVEVTADGFAVSALKRYFTKSYALALEQFLQPAFTAENFTRVKSRIMNELALSEKDPQTITRNAVAKFVWGDNHPYGEYITKATMNNVTLQDIAAYHARNVTGTNAYLVFSGDITVGEAKALAEKSLGTLPARPGARPELTVPQVNGLTVYLVDVPTAQQAQMQLVAPAMLKRSNPDVYAVNLATSVLGGGGSGRLFNNLREKHSFTYGAYSTFAPKKYPTVFNISASVKTNKVDSAVVEALNEVRRMRTEDIAPEELQLSKNVFAGDMARSLENPAIGASYAVNVLTNSLPGDYYENYLKHLNAVTVADIRKVANKYFTPDNMKVIIVGNAGQILPNLKRSGFNNVQVYNADLTPKK